jgi:hypothetical protein
METYQIRMKIEIVPCHHPPTQEPITQQDGSVSFTLSEEDAIKIDVCEQAVLQTVYPTLRATLSKHLSEVSKKKAQEHLTEGTTVVTNPWPYRVDGEVGRFTFPTHQVVSEEFILYDTAQDLFLGCRCWEQYKTSGFKELSYIYGATEQSYQKTARLINRIRYQEGATPSRTVQDGVKQEGSRLLDFLERKTTTILFQHGFDRDGAPGTDQAEYHHHAKVVAQEDVKEAIAACELSPDEQIEVEQNPVIYEQAAASVNISLDDVVVKKQKEERPGDREEQTESEEHVEHDEPDRPTQTKQGTGVSSQKDGRKYVHNTVAHIQHKEKSYTVNGYGVLAVLRIILGYLLNNDLLQYRLQFFVDGQKTLQAAIVRAFSWFTNVGLILDWPHLEDKCKRQLSLAMKGKEIRNTTLHELTRLLWYGMVDKAIAYVRNLPEEGQKDPDALRVLIGYFERNRPYIPCYEVRKRLG